MEIVREKIDKIITDYSEKALLQNEVFFFIQIGSNDGKSGDPIFEYVKKYKWQGILVEPVTYIFEKLKDTYKNTAGLFFENSAIDKEDGYKTFYRVKENDNPENPYWYDQLGSFKKEVVEKHKEAIPDFDKNFISEKIKCLSFSNLLKKYNVEKIDVLHIDTEGYDYELIKLVPFQKVRPKMILYEHKHLSISDIKECRSFLIKHGYNLLETDTDTFAYL